MADGSDPTGTMDPTWDRAAANRGQPAQPGTGEVKGSGAGAGEAGNPEDFDADEDEPANNDGGR